MKKNIAQIILYFLILIILSSSVLAASKPIAGFVFKNDTNPAQNATVIVYVNTTFGSVNPCYTLPSVFSGSDGSFATNLANLKRNDTGGDCSGLWATSDPIWAEADGSTVTIPGPQGNGSSSGDTVSPGSGLQYLSNFSIAANPSPTVSLISPANNTIITPGNVSFNFNVTDDDSINNCSLILNNVVNQTNTTITKNILQTFTTNLTIGTHTWSINCTDNSANQAASQTRTLSVSSIVVGQLQSSLIIPSTNSNVVKNQFFTFTTQVDCLAGSCGNVSAYLDPITYEEEKESQPFVVIFVDFIKEIFLEPGDFITGLAGGALVPITPSTPFWTNSSNPADLNNFTCLGNMISGSSCNVTWTVNASGSLSTTSEFFAYFNSTTYTIYNETPHINLTIVETTPPSVFNVTPQANSTFNGSQTIEIGANVTDNTNISTVLANITYPNSASQLLLLSNVNNTNFFNASFTIPNIAGTYNITFIANDTFNNINSSVSTYFSVSVVGAVTQLTQVADRLNYFSTSFNHTVKVTNNGNVSVNTTSPLPPGWTFVGGTNCSLNISSIICSLAAGANAQFIVIDPNGADPEYKITPFPISSTTNNYTGNTLQFIKIQNKELFHTLVEYGRGRGNYFFDSAFNGAGSGHEGVSCPYVPNSTLFELNFLHKITNVNQWYGNLSAIAYNATFSCSYPNRSVIREHLITSIVTNSTGAFTNYRVPSITGSWERMGFLSMDFKQNLQFIGENLTINCTNISYYLPVAGGYMSIAEDSFTLEVRNKNPFIASASTADTIGNGTQEVIITYNITNNEIYTVDDTIIEINAPPYAEFIGVRGELWGSALDQYRFEKTQLLPGESELIQLVARFDTTSAPNITSINLTSNIQIKYLTCWELNAYNPTEYTKDLGFVGAATVDMGTTSNLVNLINLIAQIDTILIQVNSTIYDINNTVNNIQTIVNIINTTTQDTNIIVKAINTTTTSLLNKSSVLLNNTNLVLNDTQFIKDQLNCNNTNDSPLCDQIQSVNQTAWNLYNLSLYLNSTANNLNITVIENINTSGLNITVSVDLTNLTSNLHTIKNFINCTNLTIQSNNSLCFRINRIENNTILINNTVQSILSTTSFFNTSVFGNLTFQQILDSINNITGDTSGVLTKIQEARSFDEEIVFLITDSFGLQTSAKNSFAQGHLTPPLNKLKEANQHLQKAVNKLSLEREVLLTLEQKKSGPLNTFWIWLGLIIILSVAGLAFLFRRVPPPNQPQPPKPLQQTQNYPPATPQQYQKQTYPYSTNRKFPASDQDPHWSY